MLIHLYISDFAVVKNLELDFQSGMTVITGETGAGKSILLDAIGLALGERAESHWVRPGCEKAEIIATFDIAKVPAAVLWLTDCDLLRSDTEECIIRRTVYANGRSKAYINGQPSTTQQLRVLGESLIQIHGQNQHQLLLKPFEQMRLLDAYGHHDDTLSALQKAYYEYEAVLEDIERLKQKVEKDPSRVTLLQYQVDELKNLQLEVDEWEHLSLEQKRLFHAQSDLASCDAVLMILNQDDLNLVALLGKAEQSLGALKNRHPTLTNAHELLIAAQVHLDETIQEVELFTQSIEQNPEKLHDIESRLTTIYNLARKHKVEPADLISTYQKLQAELDCLLSADETLANLEQTLLKAKERYVTIAHGLSRLRNNIKSKMAEAITEWMAPLGMKGGIFDIALIAHEQISPNGLETVQFMVSTNPGHPLLPLQKVVSGGELSRISLAIQLITSHYQSVPTLVFDEVDVGVGGKIGVLIGNAIKSLAAHVQVLCITHLPQVAASGDHHFQVSKVHEKNETYTTIHSLNAKERIDEVARMLGGVDITKQAKAHAKELLKES